MRRFPSLLTVIGLGLAVVACAAPSGTTPQESTGDEPSVPAARSQQASVPAAASQPAEPSQAGGGGGDPGEDLAFADGPWTGGSITFTVAGGLELQDDQPITTDISSTVDGATILAYNYSGTYPDYYYATISINRGYPFDADITTDTWSVSSSDCDVTWLQADDAGIEANFTCPTTEVSYFGGDDLEPGPVTLEGSFTATR
ncbi:MAG TPA: hypothetical protein VIH24_01910 [Candidatus Limnocylindria bacterium]|jgi:hypothetical protein